MKNFMIKPKIECRPLSYENLAVQRKDIYSTVSREITICGRGKGREKNNNKIRYEIKMCVCVWVCLCV